MVHLMHIRLLYCILATYILQCYYLFLQAGDAAQFQAYVLQFGCRINANGESCFAVQQSGRLNEVAAAFMVKIIYNINVNITAVHMLAYMCIPDF